jgi:hypothetical protein
MGNSDHGTTYMRVGGDNGELQPWHYIYVCSIASRLIRRVIYERTCGWRPPARLASASPSQQSCPGFTDYDSGRERVLY